MESTYTSAQLFHFVGRASPGDDEENFNKLLMVLRSGYISHKPHSPGGSKIQCELNPAGSLVEESLVVATITCFCDIPVDHLSIHMRKYGKFGISFSRTYLISEGARPVIYVPISRTGKTGIHEQQMLRGWDNFFKGVRKVAPQEQHKSRKFGAEPATQEEVLSSLDSIFTKDFLAFVKPFNADLDDDHEENYYLEREWRKYGYLAATPDTVGGVWMPKEFIDRFSKELPEFAQIAKPLPA